VRNDEEFGAMNNFWRETRTIFGAKRHIWRAKQHIWRAKRHILARQATYLAPSNYIVGGISVGMGLGPPSRRTTTQFT